MRNGTDFIERRKHKRFEAQKYAFAVVNSGVNKLGQIKNISIDGLAFRYIAWGGKTTQTTGSFEIDIFLSGNGFWLKKIPVKIVSDSEVDNKISFGSLPIRQLSMQFGKIEPEQKPMIEDFIQRFTSCEV